MTIELTDEDRDAMTAVFKARWLEDGTVDFYLAGWRMGMERAAKICDKEADRLHDLPNSDTEVRDISRHKAEHLAGCIREAVK